MQITVTVNDAAFTREIEPRLLLIHFLRDDLGLTGSHWGCDTSNCGACVIWLDETPVKSCTVLAVMADGHQVRTVEGMGMPGRLDPVQEGFARCHGLQCGFCTPGMMLTARWLLDHNPDPSPGRSARRCPARSAGAPATRTSSGRCGGRPGTKPRSGTAIRVVPVPARPATGPRPPG